MYDEKIINEIIRELSPDIRRIIEQVYREGYLQGSKDYSLKKKKGVSGHWERINPNQLPKEGTKVRYSREHPMYSNGMWLNLGDEGTVDFTEKGWFGIRSTDPKSSQVWLYFDSNDLVNCLDVWVEEEE